MKKLLTFFLLTISFPAFAQEAYLIEPYLDAQTRYQEQQAQQAADAAAQPTQQAGLPAPTAEDYYAPDAADTTQYEGAAAIPDASTPYYAPSLTSLNF